MSRFTYFSEGLDLLDGGSVHAALVERLHRVAVVVAPVEHADLGGDGEARDEAGVPVHHDARQLSPEVADVDAAGGRLQVAVGVHREARPAEGGGGEVDVLPDPGAQFNRNFFGLNFGIKKQLEIPS